jgi:hypothetical protein
MADGVTHDSAALRISGPERTAEAKVLAEVLYAIAADSRRSRCLSRPRQPMEEGPPPYSARSWLVMSLRRDAVLLAC